MTASEVIMSLICSMGLLINLYFWVRTLTTPPLLRDARDWVVLFMLTLSTVGYSLALWQITEVIR